MHDRNGNELKLGDVVELRAQITQLFPGANECNIGFTIRDERTESARHYRPLQYHPHICCSSLLVGKVISALLLALGVFPALAGDCRRAVSHAVVTHATYAAPVYSQAYYTVDGDGRARQIDKLLALVEKQIDHSQKLQTATSAQIVQQNGGSNAAFNAACVGCHAGASAKGGLDLSGPLSDKTRLACYVAVTQEIMPKGQKLADAEYKEITAFLMPDPRADIAKLRGGSMAIAASAPTKPPIPATQSFEQGSSSNAAMPQIVVIDAESLFGRRNKDKAAPDVIRPNEPAAPPEDPKKENLGKEVLLKLLKAFLCQ